MSGGSEPLGLAAALAGFRALLGEGAVDGAPAQPRATFATGAKALAIVRPGSREQVAECMRIAQRHAAPIYPVSRGRNWGYGSAVPSADAVVMDLGGLDRITDLDPELQLVTVEPGVTFRQLYAFLAERAPHLMVGPGPGSPEGSVLANALERGYGLGPARDRFGLVAALEVVLPDGDVVRTGAFRFGPSARAPHRFGPGPALDGLFSQSPLGVVTRLALRLQRRPRLSRVASFALAGDGGLGPLVDALRGLFARGFPAGMVTLFNDCKAFALHGQYPWAEAGGATPLPERVRRRMRREVSRGAWLGEIVLWNDARLGQAADLARVRAALGPVVDRFAAPPPIAHAIWPLVRGPYRWVTGQKVEALGRIDYAAPNERNLRCAYWRKRTPPPASGADLDRDGCGFISLLFAAPLLGDAVVAASAAVERACAEHGFEPNVGLLPLNEGCAYVLVFLVYDRDVAGEDGRALACHDAVAASLLALGLVPARLGVCSMGLMGCGADAGYGRLLARLRDALDPNAVLSPGRYPPYDPA